MDDHVPTPPSGGRRSGGRSARHKTRNAPLAKGIQPVHAGLTGGQYRPLSPHDVLRIEQTVYQLLD